jgi:hypothetical protein
LTYIYYSMTTYRRSSNVLTMVYRLHQSLLFATLVALILVSTEAQFDGFGKARMCKPYSCPTDLEPVPKWPLQLTSTGCSSMGGMQVFATINTEEDPMRICCDLRNACLQTCGSIKTFCDEVSTD